MGRRLIYFKKVKAKIFGSDFTDSPRWRFPLFQISQTGNLYIYNNNLIVQLLSFTFIVWEGEIL